MTERVSDGRLTLEAELFAFFQKKYVQSADDRQRSMGLTYTEAETHDLAKEVAEFIERRASQAVERGVTISEEMVERAYEAFVADCEWSDWDEPEVRSYVRAALTAALKGNG